MPTMGKYCKAFPLNRLAEWPEWNNKVKQPAVVPEPGDRGTALDYAFLQESYIATAGIFLDQDILFDDVTPEWIRFCRETLAFHPEEFTVSPYQTSSPIEDQARSA